MAGIFLLFTAYTLSELDIATSIDVITLLALLIASIIYIALAAVRDISIISNLHTIKWLVGFALITYLFQSYLNSKSGGSSKSNLFWLITLIGFSFYTAFLGLKKDSWSSLIVLGFGSLLAFYVMQLVQIDEATVPSHNKAWSIVFWTLLFGYFACFSQSKSNVYVPFVYGLLDILTIAVFSFVVSFKLDT